MYLTQSNVIRGLSKEEYSILREMCQYSNNLYNVALYHIRQYYFQEKKFLKSRGETTMYAKKMKTMDCSRLACLSRH